MHKNATKCNKTLRKWCKNKHGSSGSWAAVVAQHGDSAAVCGVPAAILSMPTAVSGLLQPVIAAQAEALSAELQAMFAARLEEVFQPLRDLVATM
jgi:hypothetical protein